MDTVVEVKDMAAISISGVGLHCTRYSYNGMYFFTKLGSSEDDAMQDMDNVYCVMLENKVNYWRVICIVLKKDKALYDSISERVKKLFD